MANPIKKDYAAINKAKVEKMLEKDASSVKAVIANTIETRKIARKLQELDMIFNNARQNLGYKVTFEQFETIFKKFQAADEAIDEIIKFAEEAGIARTWKKEKTFEDSRSELETLVSAGKTIADIATHFSIDEKKAEGWISIIQKKNRAEHQEEIVSKTKTTAKEKQEVAVVVA